MGILMGGVIRNATTHVALPFASACVTGTFHCYSTDGNGVWNNLSDGGAYAYSGVSVTFTAGGFFEKVLNLTNVAYFPDLGINGLWEVVELQPEPPRPDCCFTGETRVRMADGSCRRIDEIAVGECVIGHDGAINQVTHVERPLLGVRLLHAFNGGPAFVTAEHPFLSADGWKAIDPAATAAECPTLPVTRLRAGDRLLRAVAVRVPVSAGGLLDRAEVRTAEYRVTALTAHAADAATVVYNLRLDGDHTYIANDLVVHNKTTTH